MESCTGAFYVLGNEFRRCDHFDPEMFDKGYSIYEVIRIIRSKALFLEEHLERLSESVRLSHNYSYRVDHNYFKKIIPQIIAKNKRSKGNLKLIIMFPGNGDPVPCIYLISYRYPTGNEYKKGITVCLVEAERNDPNIKKVSPVIHKQTDHFESLLIDHAGNITEGSKSNVFFIRQNEVITPPDEIVLKGITRQKTISIIRDMKIRLIYAPISINNLSNMDAVFLTGTSPKILPVRTINGLHFNVDHPLMRTIMKKYDEMIEAYVY